MMLGYVHDTIKIWCPWDPEACRVIQSSDVEFDETMTIYSSCLPNETDPLGIPEEEPIYEEDLINKPFRPWRDGRDANLLLPGSDNNRDANPLPQRSDVKRLRPRSDENPLPQRSDETADGAPDEVATAERTPDEVVTAPPATLTMVRPVRHLRRTGLDHGCRSGPYPRTGLAVFLQHKTGRTTVDHGSTAIYLVNYANQYH